jgi:hypothetical protein
MGSKSLFTGTIVGYWIEHGSAFITGRIWLMREMDFEIVAIDEQTIRLKSPANGNVLNLTRVPE